MFERLVRHVSLVSVILYFASLASAQDLHFKKSISVEGNTVSSSETWVTGARERTVNNSPAGNIVTLHQCDLKQTVTLNDQTHSYLVVKDPQDESANNAAALMMGAPSPQSNAGGTITQTVTVTDTGERKQLSGYAARHLKTSVIVESSANACSQVKQKYEIDGWYADLAKEQLSCFQSLPPVKLTANCSDQIVVHHRGTGKPGYPLHETITLQNENANPTKIDVVTSDISKQPGKPELFDVPTDYRQVHSESELYAVAAMQPPTTGNATAPGAQASTQMNQAPNPMSAMGAGVPSPASMLAQGMGQFQKSIQGMQGAYGGAPQGAPQGSAVPIPQALGPKAPGKIRIGVAPAQAQLGQGNNAQADYGTPVRNAIIFMMNGPAVEIAALDSSLPIQMQAEAQQKQCDYILLSSVTVKRSNSNLGKLMKAGSMAANFTPLGMMSHLNGMGGMLATQAAATAMQTAAMSAQQQAASQLSGLNGQIKSKDEVTVEYQLVQTGQSQPKLDNTLKGKSQTDGEDVLSPLIQQAANSVLTEVTKK